MANAGAMLATHHLCGVIPRNDVRRHTQGLTQHIHAVAIKKGQDQTMDLVSRRAIKLKITGQYRDIGTRSGHGFTGVLGFQKTQLCMVGQHAFTQFHQQATAL
jgi:hypothetical protein